MVKSLFRSFSLLVLLGMLSGCGLIDAFYLPPPEDTAQELFEAGNDAMREKDYVSASNYYSRLKDNFPFSPYAVEAELSLADCYFLDEEWGLAVDAYKEFESMHPRHQAIPYVLFNIGMANVNGYPSIDRPTTQIEEAYSYFRRLRESFPTTEYAQVAEEKMVECRRLMAEHDLFYADFYFRMERYTSALLRYKHIIQEFPDVPEVHAHAVEKAKAAFVKDSEQQAEKTREQREGSWRDWFKWL
ncbi:outer membrane protein assembly factor BamD [Desulfovibrio sp. OttesenSCG-928-A18]|nr:outer membrane protein assembly factor BamD [Desulfovibrio sp. OttesenSCG-928-A18]